MKIKQLIYLLLFVLFLTGCEFVLNEVPVPEFSPSELNGTKPLNDITGRNIEGIYYCTSSDKPFGDTVVFKVSGQYLSVFTGQNTAYMVLSSGYKTDDIIFEGYWRHANNDMTGAVQLKILSSDGGRELLAGNKPVMIKVTGLHNDIESQNMKEVSFVRIDTLRPIKSDFYILAHKGGGRNIDRLPHSENSIELMKYAERLGANCIETDVKITKDSIPVLFHDDRLSTRTVNNEYLIGSISDYTYKQLQAIAPLKKGEKIPSLDDALDAVLNNTNIKLVWLDIKSPDAIPFIQPIQKKYNDLAIQKGRRLEIMMGIPDLKVYDKIRGLPDYGNIPTLCELDENHVEAVKAKIWAQRWSMGLLKDRISKMHALGKRVFVWTLDDPELIRTYLRESDFDGIVTNYAPFVAFEFYMGRR